MMPSKQAGAAAEAGLSVRPSAWRMLMTVSQVFLVVVPRIVIGGDVVFGRTGWVVFGLCLVAFPFVAVRFIVTVVGVRGVRVRRAVRTRRCGWDEIDSVTVESRGRFLVLVLRRRAGGKVEVALNFVPRSDRRLLVQAIEARAAAGVVQRDDVLVGALGQGIA